MSTSANILSRPSDGSLPARTPGGDERFVLIVIPDRYKGPMSDIGRRIGGLRRVKSVQLDAAKGKFTVTVAPGGVEARRVVGEVCAMGCMVRLLPVANDFKA